MLRLFVTSSQICTLYLSVFAKKTQKADYTDILIIDHTPKKDALVDSILEGAKIHTWSKVINLSTSVQNSVDSKPSLRKKITRKIKPLPLVRNVYNVLHRRFVEKQKISRIELLQHHLGKQPDKAYAGVFLGFLTQTAINDALIEMFPQADIGYFEHGIGDYYFVNKNRVAGSFYCVFAESFRNFIQQKNIALNVQGYITINDYKEACNLILEQNPKLDISMINGNKKIVLLLLDAADIYHPPTSFWTDYLEKCISLVDHPDNYLFVIKPHPAQSNESLKLSEDYFINSGLEFAFLKDHHFTSSSLELLFHQIQNNVHSVFSTFSSATFYLAHFYPERVKYFYLYDFVKPYFKGGPRQYTDYFNQLGPYFENVFADKHNHHLIRI